MRERVAMGTGLAQKWSIEQNAPISQPVGHPDEVKESVLGNWYSFV
jgi:hypothetical protein